MTRGIIPVPEQEIKAWRANLRERAILKEAPTPSPTWYFKLDDLVERLWIQNRDQAFVITPLQEESLRLRKAVKQQTLF
jgi:hypothetical protein